MTEELLNYLEELERTATPGPWEEIELEWDNWSNEHYIPSENKKLLLAARNAVPVLIAEVRRLKSTLEQIAEGAWGDDPTEIQNAAARAVGMPEL